MKEAIKASLDALLYLVVFLLLQVFASIIMPFLGLSSAASLILANVISSIIAIGLFAQFRWVRFSKDYIRRRPYKLLTWVGVLSAALILPSQYLEGFIEADMPEDMVEIFKMIMSHPMGYLAVGIIAPIAEEVVFRGAILRRLLDIGGHPWVAIIGSALIFGAIHGNMAQFYHAFFMGLLLGWIYLRTGSILPGIIIHWVNNSIAYGLCVLFPDKADATVVELFDGNTALLYSSLAVSIVMIVVSMWKTISLVKK